MTVSISDMTVPPQKPEMIQKAQDTVDLITKNFKRGLITEEERYKEVVETWKKTDDELTKALLTGLDKYNNICMMADSGARGSDKQKMCIRDSIWSMVWAMMTISTIWATDVSVQWVNCCRTSTGSVFPDWSVWFARE